MRHPSISGSGSDAPPSATTLQFLSWVSARPRTYAEAMDAWRTSCPRLSAGADAVNAGWGAGEAGGAGTYAAASVRLTPRGAALLQGAP